MAEVTAKIAPGLTTFSIHLQLARPARAPSAAHMGMEKTMTNKITNIKEVLSEPVTIPVEAYISETYARAERDKLWRKVWLQAGRIEEIPAIGTSMARLHRSGS